MSAKVTIWDVQGKIVIPGTRKTTNISRIRVCAETRQKASEHLAPVLNERFMRELPEGQSFSKHFAMMNLQWQEFKPLAKAQETAVQDMASHSTTEG